MVTHLLVRGLYVSACGVYNPAKVTWYYTHVTCQSCKALLKAGKV